MLALTLLIAGAASAEMLVRTMDGQEFLGLVSPDRSPQQHALTILLPKGVAVTIPWKRIDSTEERLDPSYLLARAAQVPEDYAVRLLEDALSHRPNSALLAQALRERLLKAGHSALSLRQPAHARMLFGKALALFPNDPDALDGDERCQTLLSKLAREAEGLHRHLDEHPENDLARFDLGRLYEQLGQPQQAFDEYERIIKGKIDFAGGPDQINALRELIASHLVETPTEPATSGSRTYAGPWQETRTLHFTIRYREGLDIRPFAQVAEAALAAAWRTLRPQDSGTPAVQLTLTLFLSEEEYRTATGEHIAPAVSRYPDQLFAWERTPRLVDCALPHEVMHLVIHNVLGAVPLWLDEGLAVRQERIANLHFARLRQLVANGQLLSLARLISTAPGELSTMDASGRDTFYAASFVLVEFLLTQGGVDELVQFARAVGREPDAAARTVYGHASLKVLEDAWKTFALY